MQFNKENHDKELEELQKKVADLEAQLDYQTMRADAYDTMIDIAEKRWHINIRKNWHQAVREPSFQVPSVSKKPVLLTGQGFQSPSVSKKAVLLTEQSFQSPAVSKNPDLLTGQRFQVLSVSKKADLLTGQGYQRSAVSKMGKSRERYRGE